MALLAKGENPGFCLYVLLSDYPDRTSRFLKRLGMWKYSHASISTGRASPSFFSFTGKHGFRVESPWRHPTYKGQPVNCALYRIPISAFAEGLAAGEIEDFVRRGSVFNYSYFGLILMYLGLRYHSARRHTCVSFVSRVLELSGAVPRSLCRKLVKPDDFARRFRRQIVYEGTLHQLTQTFLPDAADRD